MQPNVQSLINLSPLAPFIERATELSKKDLLARCTGEVPYAYLQLLQKIVFFRIGKTEAGDVYMM